MYPVRLVYNSIKVNQQSYRTSSSPIHQSQKWDIDQKTDPMADNGTRVTETISTRNEMASIRIGSAELKDSLNRIVNEFLSLNTSCHWIFTNSALARVVVQISEKVHKLAKQWSYRHNGLGQ